MHTDELFFATEAAAEAAADRAAQKIAFWQAERESAAIAIATIAVVGASAAVIAAWKSPLGRKVRNKIANAIKAE